MERNLSELTREPFDVCIVGGGIYGAALLWEATLRGLSAVLLEKSDFGSATSANSLKTIHGGIRYLQHADIRRMRESMRERRALMRITPHLVHPLPVLIPTYGRGMKSRPVMTLAMLLNDLLSIDRNTLPDPQKRIPNGRTISRDAVTALLPDIHREGLTGGAVLYDAQVYNSERHILSFIRSAMAAGAQAANYVEVTGFLRRGDTIHGVQACDQITGSTFDVRARMVLNTGGPWIDHILQSAEGVAPRQPLRLAKAFNIIVPRLFDTYAVGISSSREYQDSDAVVKRSSRLLFFSPWREYTMIGTEYFPYSGHPDGLTITPEELQTFLDDVNAAYPGANLHPDDVRYVHSGLLPMSGVDAATGQVQLLKQYRIQDHRAEGGSGLASVVGVKYTTARDVAERTIDWVFRDVWGQSPPRSTSSRTRLFGGEIERFDRFLTQSIEREQRRLSASTVRALVHNYGSAYPRVLRYMEQDADTADERIAVACAQTRHAVFEEMAQSLEDVIFRRTEIGSAGPPEPEILHACAQTMARIHGWQTGRIRHEIRRVEKRYGIDHLAYTQTEMEQ